MVYLDPISLSEQIAIVSISCMNCHEDIEIGDDCYVDTSAGVEEHSALIYCIKCVENFLDA